VEHPEAIREVLNELIERADRDAAFKRLLVRDPFTAAAEAGVAAPGEVQGWMKFRVVEDSDSIRYLLRYARWADEPADGPLQSRRFAPC
jgi:hypothetical protein